MEAIKSGCRPSWSILTKSEKYQDKDHKHIHLYVNRIDFKGVSYNDSFIGKRSQLQP